MTIKELLQLLDEEFPFGLALNWDKVGLQVGSSDKNIKKILLTLDVTKAVVDHAISLNVNVIITHHPLIFRSLDSITDPLIIKLIENRIAVISMHTNLDCAANSVNHCLANALGLKVLESLSIETGARWHHLSVTVPPEAVQAVSTAAFKAGAGRIGHYKGCSTRHGITGTFLPLPASQPYVGTIGIPETVYEDELEMMVDSFRLARVISAINNAHPYETPALYHFPVSNNNPAYGLGLICQYDQDRTILEIADIIRSNLGNSNPHIWLADKNLDSFVRRIAICSGEASSIIPTVISRADLLIGGDFTYHDIIGSPIPLIDAGHFWTEYPVLAMLSEILKEEGLDCVVFPRQEHEFTLRYQ